MVWIAILFWVTVVVLFCYAMKRLCDITIQSHDLESRRAKLKESLQHRLVADEKTPLELRIEALHMLTMMETNSPLIVPRRSVVASQK